jgi:hypothetical protein
MAEPERDPRVLEAYRALGDEAPPASLDAAILAAARRRGPRWPVPLAAAAALVLAVGVALVVQREEVEKKDEVALAPQVITARESQAELAKKSEPAPAVAQAPAPASPPAARQRMADAGKRTEQPLAAAPAAGRGAAEPAEDRAPAVAGAMLESRAKAEAETPQQWLERIARLREAGRHQEADESLAEFRRRHPGYEIPEAMRARVLAR